MGRYKVNNDGTLGAMISGRGKAEYGASTVRTGSLSVTGIPKAGSPPAYKEITVTFDSPMPDANYELETSVGYQAFVFTAISNKTANGFRAVFTSIYTNSNIDITFTYTAYKLYTDTEYNNILAAMPSDASASNKLVTEAVVNDNKSFGTPIDIKGYDIANNMYTAPSDGLFVIRNQGSESGYFYINTVINGSTVTLIAENGGYKGQSVFAKKGTRVFCTFDNTITASNMKVVFIPFV